MGKYFVIFKLTDTRTPASLSSPSLLTLCSIIQMEGLFLFLCVYLFMYPHIRGMAGFFFLPSTTTECKSVQQKKNPLSSLTHPQPNFQTRVLYNIKNSQDISVDQRSISDQFLCHIFLGRPLAFLGLVFSSLAKSDYIALVVS